MMEFSKATVKALEAKGQKIMDQEARRLVTLECDVCGWRLQVFQGPGLGNTPKCGACGSWALRVDGQALCPGCSGIGVLTDDPEVLKCSQCGGIFTNRPIPEEAALAQVRFHLPMLAQVGMEGTFYFDLEITRQGDRRNARRIHGYADKRTKRVVQWG